MLADVILIDSVEEIDRIFTYNVNPNFLEQISVGSRVLVPFGKGNRIREGVVFELKQGNVEKYKYIKDVFDDGYELNEEIIDLILELKEYYLSTYSKLIKAAIPSGSKLKILTNYYYEDDKYRKLVEDNKVSIGKLIDQGKVKQTISYDKKSSDKYTNILKINISHDELEEVIKSTRKNAVNVLKVLNYFLDGKHKFAYEKSMSVPPSTIKSLVDKKVIELQKQRVFRDNVYRLDYDDKVQFEKLNEEQEIAFDKINKDLTDNVYRKYLLHGVTSSGKTEIYMRLAKEALDQNKEVLVLVPEISLIPQIAERFAQKFNEKVGFYHSKMSSSEKMDEWYRIKNGELKIVIGARSAVFVPFKNLGLIVIDEEHSLSYKSEIEPKYNAKHVASIRAKYNNAPIIFASATPSIDTYSEIYSGKMELIELKNRVNNVKMPKVMLVDMRKELKNGNKSIFSETLEYKINEKLDRGEQIILFINKKGYSSFISCRECGYVMKCPHCDVSLIYQKGRNIGQCKICGYETKMEKKCPECGSEYFKFFGIGTEKVEEIINKKFKKAKVIRMDSYSMRGKHDLKNAYDAINSQEYNIILGTQIVAKGHDFKNVTLVGILAADINLNVPSYNASEVTYQLLTQAIGRSGRGEIAGEVVVQTYSPDHYAVISASENDYKLFMEYEMEIRKELEYPPFKKLINIMIFSKQEKKAYETSKKISEKLTSKLLDNKIDIKGPGPAILEKAKGLYRYQIIIKIGDIDQKNIKGIINNICNENRENSTFISIDIDPISLI